MQGTGKADWQEAFSDGTDPPAQAGTRGEVGNKKMILTRECFTVARFSILRGVILSKAFLWKPSLKIEQM